ncbi:MAG: leucine-rich repeat domain-containing protein [Clostridia bacterium]|nr:leucine-rich repeat domain-containing protein [Clostridia bacterium]
MKKKLLITLLAIIATIACTLALAACGGNEDNSPTIHSHTWSTTYTEDGDRHYQTCSSCNDKHYTEHSYIEGVCICGKLLSVNGTIGLMYAAYNGGESYSVIGCSLTEKNIIIPSEYNGKPVTSISNFAFENCSLESITIPSSVTYIAETAFWRCPSMTNIIVKDGNTKYHSSGNCLVETESKTLIVGCSTSLIPTDESVTKIGNAAFCGCTSLTDITIPDNITEIGIGAFNGCTSLENATLPQKITDLCTGLFSNCSALKTIFIPDSVIVIGDSAFYGCTALNDIILPDSITTICGYAFYGCSSLSQITIPSNITSISGDVFFNCTSLESITINYGVTSIDSTAFRGCTSLKELSIPDSVTYIGEDAFSSCTSLTSITIPNSVTYIGEDAFSSCTSLTSITIPNSVTYISSTTLSGCTSLTTIIVAENNPNYKSVNNCLLNKAGTKLIVGCKNSIIPDSVTSIGDFAFYDCSSLTKVTIGNSVNNIGYYAFRGCSSLTSITFEDTVAEWNAIIKGDNWDLNTGDYTIYCTDGEIAKDGTITMY